MSRTAAAEAGVILPRASSRKLRGRLEVGGWRLAVGRWPLAVCGWRASGPRFP
jgi:hypothetical protein